VAAGSAWFGFALEQTTAGQTRTFNTCPVPSLARLRSRPLGTFRNNSAHTARASGVWLGDVYQPEGVALIEGLQVGSGTRGLLLLGGLLAPLLACCGPCVCCWHAAGMLMMC
jgi:hypothetical protein